MHFRNLTIPLAAMAMTPDSRVQQLEDASGSIITAFIKQERAGLKVEQLKNYKEIKTRSNSLGIAVSAALNAAINADNHGKVAAHNSGMLKKEADQVLEDFKSEHRQTMESLARLLSTWDTDHDGRDGDLDSALKCERHADFADLKNKLQNEAKPGKLNSTKLSDVNGHPCYKVTFNDITDARIMAGITAAMEEALRIRYNSTVTDARFKDLVADPNSVMPEEKYCHEVVEISPDEAYKPIGQDSSTVDVPADEDPVRAEVDPLAEILDEN